eukprot:4832210-Pyramimonas_sp.AAC.1
MQKLLLLLLLLSQNISSSSLNSKGVGHLRVWDVAVLEPLGERLHGHEAVVLKDALLLAHHAVVQVHHVQKLVVLGQNHLRRSGGGHGHASPVDNSEEFWNVKR